jgi:hypothetical protein
MMTADDQGKIVFFLKIIRLEIMLNKIMSARGGSAFGGKKIILFLLVSVFALTGCGKISQHKTLNINPAYNQPDLSCLTAADCKIVATTCGPSCDCGTAVNKNWQLKCPAKSFDPNNIFECAPCMPVEAKCVNNKCQQAKSSIYLDQVADELVPLATKDVFTDSSLSGQKFRLQGCFEPHKCSALPDLCNIVTGCVKQVCDLDHLANCCDCIRNDGSCYFVDLQKVAKDKLTEIRNTEATKYNVEVVGKYIGPAVSQMRPIQIEATDIKILGECLPQK